MRKKLVWSFLVCISILVEFIVLRFLFKWGFHLKVGWPPFITDYDLAIPLLLILPAYLVILQRFESNPIQFSFQKLWLHIGSLLSWIAFSSVFLNSELIGLNKVLWCAFALFNFVTLIRVFIPLSLFYKSRDRFSVFVFIFLAMGPLLGKVSSGLWWGIFHEPTRAILSWIMKHTLGNVCSLIPFTGNQIVFNHRNFALFIGEQCSGADVLWAGLSATVAMLYFRVRINKNRIFEVMTILFLFPFLYGINIVRLCLLFWLGHSLQLFLDRDLAIYLLLQVFHLHVGWLLCLGFTACYLKVMGWFERWWFSSFVNIDKEVRWAN